MNILWIGLAVTVAAYLLWHLVRKTKPTTYAVFVLPLLAIPVTLIVIVAYVVGCEILPRCNVTLP